MAGRGVQEVARLEAETQELYAENQQLNKQQATLGNEVRRRWKAYVTTLGACQMLSQRGNQWPGAALARAQGEERAHSWHCFSKALLRQGIAWAGHCLGRALLGQGIAWAGHCLGRALLRQGR
jgi:hypothetical protein